MLVECYHQAKIPEGVVRLLVGGPDQGKALAADPVAGVLLLDVVPVVQPDAEKFRDHGDGGAKARSTGDGWKLSEIEAVMGHERPPGADGDVVVVQRYAVDGRRQPDRLRFGARDRLLRPAALRRLEEHLAEADGDAAADLGGIDLGIG